MFGSVRVGAEAGSTPAVASEPGLAEEIIEQLLPSAVPSTMNPRRESFGSPSSEEAAWEEAVRNL